MKYVTNWIECDKFHILTKNNTISSYECSKGANVQPIVDFFKRHNPVPIEALFIQHSESAPMVNVTETYKF